MDNLIWFTAGMLATMGVMGLVIFWDGGKRWPSPSPSMDSRPLVDTETGEPLLSPWPTRPMYDYEARQLEDYAAESAFQQEVVRRFTAAMVPWTWSPASSGYAQTHPLAPQPETVTTSTTHWPPRPELYDSPWERHDSPSEQEENAYRMGVEDGKRSTPLESPKSGAPTSTPSSNVNPIGTPLPSVTTVTHSVSGSSGEDGRERVKTYSIPSLTSESRCACESCVGDSGAAVAGPAPQSSGSSEPSVSSCCGAEIMGVNLCSECEHSDPHWPCGGDA